MCVCVCVVGGGGGCLYGAHSIYGSTTPPLQAMELKDIQACLDIHYLQTRTVFSEENVCPPAPHPSLNRPIIEKGCIYNLSLFFACVWSVGAIFQNLRPSVTLKMRSRSPKSNQFLSLSQQYCCTSLVKIYPFILEIGCRKAIFQQSEPSCDLENGVRSPKSN